MDVIKKLNKLRELMKEKKIDAYLISDSDKHSSEYVNDYYKERSFMSNFNGSNGTLLVTLDGAYLWTDGRYFLQADIDLKDTTIKLMKMLTPGYPSLIEFLKENYKDKIIGLNGETYSYSFINEIKEFMKIESHLDLVDDIWENRGTLITKPIWKVSTDLVGENVSSKLNRLREEIKKNNASSILLSNIDDNCWLYNLRGGDISITPAFLSFSYVTLDKAYIFINTKVIEDDAKEQLLSNDVEIRDYDSFLPFLSEIKNETIMISYSDTNYAFVDAVTNNNTIISKRSPIQLFKSIKNETEIRNNIDVHKADGLAVLRFMKYIKENHKKIHFNEWMLAEKILEYRKMDKRFYEISFDSIVGWNANGAIVHYEPSKDKYSDCTSDGLLLVDSGGQYMGGTTDITRTYALGMVTDEMKYYYTLVLKSHIDVAKAKFLKGTTGINIDTIARMPLWERNLDYKHGTGHGVGFMLNVHEGPNSIRWAHNPNAQSFIPGMITSNEPGIYLTDKFGVRIESEVLCVEDYKDELNEFYSFKTITYAPIDIDPIDKTLLTLDEINWLNNYHKMVRETLAPMCSREELEFLNKVTREI